MEIEFYIGSHYPSEFWKHYYTVFKLLVFLLRNPNHLWFLFFLNVTFPLTLDSFQIFFFFFFGPHCLKFHGDVLVHLFLTHCVEYLVGPFSLEFHVLQFWELIYFIGLYPSVFSISSSCNFYYVGGVPLGLVFLLFACMGCLTLRHVNKLDCE